MLNGREFIVVEPLRPGDPRAGVHLLPMPAIELRGGHAAVFVPQSLRTDFGVAVPQRLVSGEGIHHLRALPLPLRVLVPVEDAVRHVAGADHRTGHDAADLVPWSRQAQDRPRENALALLALGDRPCGLVGLGVIEHHQAGPDRLPVGPLELHPPNAAGQPGDLDDRAAGERPAIVADERTESLVAPALRLQRRQHDVLGRPTDVRPLSLIQLAVAAIRNPLQRLDRMAHLGVIGQQQVVGVEFGLDRFEPARPDRIAAGQSWNDTDQRVVAVPNYPPRRSIACPSSEPIRHTNSRCP